MPAAVLELEPWLLAWKLQYTYTRTYSYSYVALFSRGFYPFPRNVAQIRERNKFAWTTTLKFDSSRQCDFLTQLSLELLNIPSPHLIFSRNWFIFSIETPHAVRSLMVSWRRSFPNLPRPSHVVSSASVPFGDHVLSSMGPSALAFHGCTRVTVSMSNFARIDKRLKARK